MHNDHCFVSVIIPVFNDQTGIDKCIKALLRQSWPIDRFEIIVVDNGSYPPIKVSYLHNNIVRLVKCIIPGSYAARNAGICVSKGEVIAFIDADCFPASDWISSGVAALERQGYRCIIGGRVDMILSQKPTAVELYQYSTGFQQNENIDQFRFSTTANLFVTKAHLLSVGLFNDEFLSCGDREWCWRAAHFGFPVKYASEVKVTTTPRRSFIAAFRQTRRVAGGRNKLYMMDAPHVYRSGIKPRRTGFRAVKWILSHPCLSNWNKIRVFSAALVIKIIQTIEKARLLFGFTPQRL